MTFPSFESALQWARVNARDYCHPYHRWRVIEVAPREYKVAIYSINTGKIDEFAA